LRITKVYTRTGDKGTTGLADGSRIKKNDIRIDTYGVIDELNSVIGICLQLSECLQSEDACLFQKWLTALQNDLFNIGSDLATPIESRWPSIILVSETEVQILEKMIDFCQTSLPPLKEFVLPGGTLLNAHLHLARTICRRAERAIVTLQDLRQINPFILPYINRLSDLFFVLSRWVQGKAKKQEVFWSKSGGLLSLKGDF
jgi:cob(I)alamin adenosyltransferase